MVQDNTHFGYSHVEQEEHKRHPEARNNSFKAAQARDMNQKTKKSQKTKGAPQSGAWGPMYQSKDHFVDMHMY